MHCSLRLLGIAALLLPTLGVAAEETATPALQQLDLTHHWVGYFSLAVMVAAYVAATFEEVTELRKSKPMLLAATLIWLAIVFAYQQQGLDPLAVTAFKGNLQTYIELLLFIMVSMTYLNAMEDMRIFDALKVWLTYSHILNPKTGRPVAHPSALGYRNARRSGLGRRLGYRPALYGRGGSGSNRGSGAAQSAAHL